MTTAVDRATRCIVGWDVVWERTTPVMQAMLDRGPQAEQYYSDLFNTYGTLVYLPGHHEFIDDKSQTYSVEGDNAELRHYLARLGRKSRCFSRSIRPRRALRHAHQNGFVSTSQTIAASSSTGISLNQRRAVDDGSGRPLATPRSQRPAAR